MTPDGLKNALKYGSTGHRRVFEAVKERMRLSERRMKDRYDQIAINEERFQAYIPESENDALRRQKRDTRGVPAYRTIEVPYSYATLLTAHTYYTSIFLSRDVVFQVAGRHGESEQQTQAVEAVLDYQRLVGEMMVPLYIWLLDPGKAGFGVVGHYWDQKFVNARTISYEPVKLLGVELPGLKPRQVETVQRIPAYEGNRLYNVRPQDWFPDPRVGMRFFQKGEFCARYVENSWSDIIAGDKSGKYFNVDELKRRRNARDAGADGIVSRAPGGITTSLPNDTTSTDYWGNVPPGFIKSYEFYIRLVPSDWQFGPESDPEIWCMTVAANGILYGCEPLGEWHGDFPFDVIEQEVEGYSLFSRSMMEVCEPLSDILTWLLNTHFYNVRQTLNNQFIVDPSMVVMKDLERPDPGKLVRLKPQAYGKDVNTVLKQLTTIDITKQHIGDMEMIGEIIQRITGVTDATMGMLPQKSHTTATASRISSSFGVNRMKTTCEYMSAMGFAPLTQKLIARTQQFMSIEKQYRLVGDLAQFTQSPFVQVDPASIAGFYDFVPVDGTLPVDRFAQANLWQMILAQLPKFPQVMATYDIAKIFGWVANLAGVRNLAQFRLTPDAMLQQQIQAGNVVPISQAMKDNPPQQKGNLNEPRQIPGMGATG